MSPEQHHGTGRQVVMVTGAGSGMGVAVAERFADLGARVVAVDVAGEAVRATVERLVAAGGEASAVAVDVSDERAITAAVEEIAARHGGLDVAVNAAAVHPERARLHQVDTSTFDRVVAVNLRGVFLCMRAQIAQMLRQESGGAIVNFASVNSVRAGREAATYTATKHAVLGLTRAAAVEYARDGIRINAVAPGAVDTPMLREAMASRGVPAEQWEDQLSPLGRFGRPEELAEAAVWLTSPAASFVVGHLLVADGGYLAG